MPVLACIIFTMLSGCAAVPPRPEDLAKYPDDVKLITANIWLSPATTNLSNPERPCDLVGTLEFFPDGRVVKTWDVIGYTEPGKFGGRFDLPRGCGVFHSIITYNFYWFPLGNGRFKLTKCGEAKGDPPVPFGFTALAEDTIDFSTFTKDWIAVKSNDPRIRFNSSQIVALTNKWSSQGPSMIDSTGAQQSGGPSLADILGVVAATAPLMTANQTVYNVPSTVRHVPAALPPRTSTDNGTANIISHQNASQAPVTPATVAPRVVTSRPVQGVQTNYGAAIVSATNALAPPRNDPKKISPGRQVSHQSFGHDSVQITITITKIYTYLGAEANRGEPYNSFKTTFDGTFTNNNNKAAQFQFWVDAVFNNGRTLPINDGHGGLNGGRSIEKYLGSFEGADLVQMANFKMTVKLK